MLCCWESPSSKYAPLDASGNGDVVVNAFPGRRNAQPSPRSYPTPPNRVGTSGNAYAQVDPRGGGGGGGGGGGNKLISVTVPQGVYPGQPIQVDAQDGSGRLVSAVVPPGAVPGSTFLVTVPENPPPPQATTTTSPPIATGSFSSPASPTTAPIVAAAPSTTDPIPTTTATPIDDEHDYGGKYGDVVGTTSSTSHLGSGQKLLHVRVPPGATPGTTLNVRTPENDGRVVAVTVPPGGVSEFQVAYDPSSSPTTTTTTASSTTTALPLPLPPTSPLPAQLPPPQHVAEHAGDASQKLILVQVPPGTAPGTTLHVQIPGENRTVAAVVPPGGVREFHVAYPSASSPTCHNNNYNNNYGAPQYGNNTNNNYGAPQYGNNTNNNYGAPAYNNNNSNYGASPYGGGNGPQQQTFHGQPQSQYNGAAPTTRNIHGKTNHGGSNYDRNNNDNNNGGGGSRWGQAAMVAAPILAGVAAYEMLSHHHHEDGGGGGDTTNYDETNDYYGGDGDAAGGDAYDDGGNDGGGDWGDDGGFGDD